MCVLGALGGIGGCLQGGVWGDGIVLNDVLGALCGLGGVLEVTGCFGGVGGALIGVGWFWKVLMEAFCGVGAF